MKKRNLVSAFGLLLGTCATVSAADILLVDNSGDVSNDSLVAFLTSECHTVTQELRREGPENANDFDLVIISRDTNSNGYNDPGEAAAWNAVTAPMINFIVFFYTQSVWGRDSDPVWGWCKSLSVKALCTARARRKAADGAQRAQT